MTTKKLGVQAIDPCSPATGGSMRSIASLRHGRLRQLGAAVLFLTVSFGCGDDTQSMPADTDATGEPTGSSSAAASDGDASSSGLGTSSTSMDASSEGTTSEGIGSTGDPGSTSDASSTGNSTALGGPYDACQADTDCEPDLRCSAVAGYCTPACDMAVMDCPLPSSGDATPNCVKSSRGSLCRLSCSDATVCPERMFCNDTFPGPPPSCAYP